MIFRKSKMLARLEREDLLGEVTEEITAIMDNLDGQPATTNSWQRIVLGQPVLTCKGKDGEIHTVFEEDCD